MSSPDTQKVTQKGKIKTMGKTYRGKERDFAKKRAKNRRRAERFAASRDFEEYMKPRDRKYTRY